MANENAKNAGPGQTEGRIAHVAAMKAGRKVLSEKISKLTDEEVAALRIVKSAKSAIQTLYDRVVERKQISGEALRACSMLVAETGSTLFK